MADLNVQTTEDSEKFTDPSPYPDFDSDLVNLCNVLQRYDILCLVVHYSCSGDKEAVEEIHHDPEYVHLPLWLHNSIKCITKNYCPDGYKIYKDYKGYYGTLTVYPFKGLAKLEYPDRFVDMESMDDISVTLSEKLRQRLVQLGVGQITTRFNGGEDHGQLEAFDIDPENIDLDDELATELEDFLLKQLPPGWEINGGSFGKFTVNVREGTVNLDGKWCLDSIIACWRWRQYPLVMEKTMAHPHHHALSSVKKWGGQVEDYLPIHQWFDASKAHLDDFRHRALRHHSEGIFWAEEVFGPTITNADGKVVPVRFIGEQHVKEDLGWIPTLQDWFKSIEVQSWMAE